MKKVVYSVSRTNRYGSTKMTGLGFVTESDLIIACNGKSGKAYIRVFKECGKAYIRVFKECVKNCHAVPNRPDEFKGTLYEIREIEVETKNSSGESTGYETREFEVEYSVWYKFVD